MILNPKFVALAICAFGTSVPARAFQEECSDTGRIEAGKAGTEVTGSVPCPDLTLTFEILGQSVTLSSPSTCPIGLVERDADCWTCGGVSVGNDCDSTGFTITVKVFSAAGSNVCPLGPTSIPKTLAEFTKSMRCIPPPLLNTEDTICASTVACEAPPEPTSNNSHLLHGETSLGINSIGIRRDWNADLDGTLSAPNIDEFKQFVQFLPRISSRDLPAALASAYGQHLPIGAIGNIHVTTRVQYFEGSGFGAVENIAGVSGAIFGDGRFSVTIPRRTTSPDGTAGAYIEEVAYDGATLFLGRIGANVYQAYSSSYPRINGILDGETFHLESLRRWVVNPFSIQRLENVTYIETQLPDSSVTRVVETYPRGSFPEWAGSMVYYLESVGGFTRPASIEMLDAAGDLLVRKAYTDYRNLGATWRPMEVSEDYFYPGSPEPYLRLSHTVQYAQDVLLGAADGEEFWTQPEPASGWWVVHE